jgi:2-methylcitrate dehydratase PrpD
MMTGREDVEIKPVLQNGTYAIMKSYTKPYASCRYTHPSVEAAIHMREFVRPEDVESISIKTYDLAVSGHDHTEIPGSYSAKMSIPYATAVGLIFGRAGLREFEDDMVRRPDLIDLTRKIKVEADSELSAVFPAIQAAVVTIKTSSVEFIQRIDFPKGEPENPLTEEEFRDRFDALMDYAGINRSISSKVFEAAHRREASMGELMMSL